ncbi:MAG: putative acetyltransferase [Frankiales bacterium]|nr:putative acetyltransferase [Frankiales bacterium]
MSWIFGTDLAEFTAATTELLSRQPAENTIALSIVAAMQRGREWSAEPAWFGWFIEGERVSGAVLRTPPYNLLLTMFESGAAARTLAPELLAWLGSSPDRSMPTGVTGTSELADQVARAWCELTGRTPRVSMRERLHVLDALQPPTVPGRSRAATAQDADLVVRWFDAFQAESMPAPTSMRAEAIFRIGVGLIWLHEDPAGSPVSLAGRNLTAVGIARVGPVYTPPEFRGHGYAAAVTAACTQDALDRDADQVVLFTDLSNATANGVYQRIGYRYISDHSMIAFD